MANNTTAYLKPSESIQQILNQNIHFHTFISPNNKYIIHARLQTAPPIQKLAKNITSMAGYKFYTDTLISTDITIYDDVYVTLLTSNQLIHQLDPIISHIAWSADSKQIIYCKNSHLHIYNLADKQTTQIPHELNLIDDQPFDISKIKPIVIVRCTVKQDPIPIQIEPITFENKSGFKIPKRTIPFLLRNKSDKTNFISKMNSVLYVIDLRTKQSTKLTETAPIKDFSLSVTSAYVMYKTYTNTSTVVSAEAFGFDLYVRDLATGINHLIQKIPAQETELSIKDATKAGPRNFHWVRHQNLDQIVWFEALDGGDPRVDVEFRDQVMLFNPTQADLTSDSKIIAKTTYRCRSVQLDTLDRFWIRESSQKKKIVRIGLVKDSNIIPIFTFDADDLYANPGHPLTILDELFYERIYVDHPNNIWLSHSGHTSEGIRPYVYAMNLDHHPNKKQILWTSSPDAYERPSRLLRMHSSYLTLMYSTETQRTSRSYKLFHIRSDLTHNKINSTYEFIAQNIPITDHSVTYKSIEGYQKELAQYKRSDGINLTAMIYTPNKYVSGYRPVLIWAYPEEYNRSENTGQIRTSAHMFDHIGWSSPLFWLSKGYIVVDDCDMPILGTDSGTNLDFITQLKLNAEAIVSVLKSKGMTDGTNIAVGGHSFGAFMTANLLTHTDLFTCGIARSGAYNRTLTPFGFQFEDRDLWTVPEIYADVSPFMHADKINCPILLIHGQSDSNPGTFPIQSERYYEALRGLGKEAKLLILPFEDHSYEATESIEHMLRACEDWLDKFMKKIDSSND